MRPNWKVTVGEGAIVFSAGEPRCTSAAVSCAPVVEWSAQLALQGKALVTSGDTPMVSAMRWPSRMSVASVRTQGNIFERLNANLAMLHVVEAALEEDGYVVVIQTVEHFAPLLARAH